MQNSSKRAAPVLVLELITDLAREMAISLAEHLLDLLVLELIKDLARDVHSLCEHPRLSLIHI